MSISRVKDPSGIVWALYVSGPSKKEILLPIGNCVVYDVSKKCCLTASHVLKAAPSILKNNDTEIAAEFVCFMVGVRCGFPKPLRYEVIDSIEILPEVTVLYLSSYSHGDNKIFPNEQAFIPDTKPVNILWPVLISGYPTSIQNSNIQPDEDKMELIYKGSQIYDYHVSGIVAGYYHDSAPFFIDSNLLPVFVIDNAVLPGMSGCAVIRNTPQNHNIVGIVIKNIAVTSNNNSTPEVVHTLCVCISGLTVQEYLR